MKPRNLELATALRHDLHRHPELSMRESGTKQRLMDFLRAHTTNLHIEDRESWFYAWYEAGEGRPWVAFRADYDAIAMDEGIALPHASQNPGVSHKCGHDGHAAALAGFALEVDQNGAANNLVFLFQPGEETGQGAAACLGVFDEKPIGLFYAWHNMPGEPRKAVAIRNETMFCASTGIVINFKGANAHASMPEKGVSPAPAIARVIDAIPGIYDPAGYRGLTLCTVVHIEAGERTFGIAAGQGSLWLTCRGQYQDEMDAAIARLLDFAKKQAEADGLGIEISMHETFPETANHPAAADKVRAACQKLGTAVVELENPYRSSEDFGHFLSRVPGAMFLIGAGDVPQVHTIGFDFDDGLIEGAVALFKTLAEMA